MSAVLEETFIKKRKMVELSLSACRKRVSPQTGFLHFYREDPSASRQDPIPFLENVFYVYALFRSKLIENISEGKTLLSKLLAFEVEGNFPVYLHEFPETKEAQLSSHLLPVLFYLLKDFSVALGEEFSKQLKFLTERILFSLKKQEGKLAKSSQARIDAFLGVFDPSSWTPKTPSEWAEFCVCSQMMGLDPLKALEVWNPSLCVFTGSFQRLQEEKEPAVTLFDLFMGEYFQCFSKRSLLDHSVHIKASLVHPYEKEESLIPSQLLVPLLDETQRQSLTFYFGSPEKVHSLVLESKKGSWKILEGKEAFECLYLYEEVLPSEEECMEFSFYLDDSQEHEWKVEGEKATVFHPGEVLSIHSGFLEFQIRIFTENSDGRFMGHVLKGDRSFQMGRKLPYGGYDWKFGFRTIQRSSFCKAKIQIQIFQKTLP